MLKEFDADPARDLIVIYDEIALSLGTLRIRERGSSGGHNGVKSISGALGSEEWLRIRIGVAPPGDEEAESARRGRKDYVLTPMSKAQLAILDEVLDRTARAVEMVLAQGSRPGNERVQSPRTRRRREMNWRTSYATHVRNHVYCSS